MLIRQLRERSDRPRRSRVGGLSGEVGALGIPTKRPALITKIWDD